MYLRRMSMLAFGIRDNKVNRDRLIKVCMVHDLAEAIVGDITPYDGVSKEEKKILEEVITVVIKQYIYKPFATTTTIHLVQINYH